LPVGIQVTIRGSDADFLVELQDLLRNDSNLRAEYNRIKRENAVAGADVYRHAKNDFLQPLLDRTEL
jgi:GrpB-like predicted nucleotidyltransferase (UPF0157 family)